MKYIYLIQKLENHIITIHTEWDLYIVAIVQKYVTVVKNLNVKHIFVIIEELIIIVI